MRMVSHAQKTRGAPIASLNPVTCQIVIFNIDARPSPNRRLRVRQEHEWGGPGAAADGPQTSPVLPPKTYDPVPGFIVWSTIEKYSC
jgi:hypothetical protein